MDKTVVCFRTQDIFYFWMKVWDLEAAKLVRTLTGHRDAVRCVDFHPYGDFLVSGSSDSSIKLWDSRKRGEYKQSVYDLISVVCTYLERFYCGYQTKGLSGVRLTP